MNHLNALLSMGRRQDRRAGFSLVELVMVVAMIAIFSALAIETGIHQWQRERVNGMAVQLAGWIDTVRRSSLRGTSCMIQINTGTISQNGTLAQTVDDASVAGNNNCLSSTPLKVNENSNMTFSVSSSTASNFGFTPRGTLTPSTSTITISLALTSGGPSRCVQLSGLLGVVSVGRGSGASCTTNSGF